MGAVHLTNTSCLKGNVLVNVITLLLINPLICVLIRVSCHLEKIITRSGNSQLFSANYVNYLLEVTDFAKISASM